ncbi:hypothetical protein [Kitasatospora aureofaciens]|uniref:hypothetical protein n=1 Tax=Kitasatospora aureofaciens TaxID=1894 RepID=UPI0033CA1CE8
MDQPDRHAEHQAHPTGQDTDAPDYAGMTRRQYAAVVWTEIWKPCLAILKSLFTGRPIPDEIANRYRPTDH